MRATYCQKQICFLYLCYQNLSLERLVYFLKLWLCHLHKLLLPSPHSWGLKALIAVKNESTGKYSKMTPTLMKKNNGIVQVVFNLIEN